MIADPLAVPVTASLDEMEALFGRYSFLGIPVVDFEGVLLGVVERSDVEHALAESAQSDHMKSLGLAREESRSMPVWFRSRRRLSWLSVNILLNMIAASVIASYQEDPPGRDRSRDLLANDLGHEWLLGESGGCREHA